MLREVDTLMASGEVRSRQGVRAVVVVPIYNHAASIVDVLDRIVSLGYEIIVVDDGSTDSTSEVLVRWNSASPVGLASVLTHPSNRGKAAALRTGFDRATTIGATHAVTIDADGQLDPEDIPGLLDVAVAHPRALVLGRRPDQMEGCPARCVVGRRNASLAALAQTGLRLSDTQCGLRVYPLELLGTVRCSAGRYAFEAEIVTRAAWAGFDVLEAPVRCRYFSADKRVSHWRPWRDSLRQGAVHVRLLAVAMIPSSRRSSGATPIVGQSRVRRLLRWLNPVRSWREVRQEPIGDLEFASGLAIGAWIGTLPFFGLHTILSMYVAWRLHQQPAAVVLGSQVSMPPLGVFLAAASMILGHFMLTGTLIHVDVSSLTWSSAWRIPLQGFTEWLLGSMVLGVLVAAVVYFLGLWIAGRARRADQPARDG
jgi:glycosyltransferase involved in cell wall biosynthesis/uncharacterized protein (DUF2062 family)